MLGKTILIVVMGFIMIFTGYGLYNANVANQAFDQMMEYEAQNTAYNIAQAGANVAFSRLNSILPKPPVLDDMHDISFGGGTFDINCVKNNTTLNYYMTCVGSYVSGGKTYKSKVVVSYEPGSWGRYAYYSENEGSGIYWMAQDAIYGPFHTQSTTLNVSRHPYFGGETSMKGTDVHYETNYTTDNPNFVKGLFTGVDRPMTDNSMDSTLWAAKNGNAWWITGKSDVYLTFAGTKVTYKYTMNGTQTTKNISDVTKNGVIYVDGGDLHIKGTVDAQLTLLATGPVNINSTDKGNIWLDGSITLTNNPQTNPNSNNFLGLVATNNVWITNKDDAGNSCNNSSISIDAAIYCHEGGFGAYNYDSRGKDGTINLYGGIVQNTRKAVSSFSGSSISNGFAKNYRYDDRFERKWPPFYPCGKAYRILSWYDGVVTQ